MTLKFTLGFNIDIPPRGAGQGEHPCIEPSTLVIMTCIGGWLPFCIGCLCMRACQCRRCHLPLTIHVSFMSAWSMEINGSAPGCCCCCKLNIFTLQIKHCTIYMLQASTFKLYSTVDSGFPIKKAVKRKTVIFRTLSLIANPPIHHAMFRTPQSESKVTFI